MKLPNYEISQTIVKRMPSGTYSSINVTLVEDFEFGGRPKEAKVITLQVLRLERCVSFFHAILTGFGLIDSNIYKQPVDEGKLQKQLIGAICSDSQGFEQIKLAFDRCTKLVLGVSTDCKAVQLNIENDNVILVSCKVAQVVKGFLPIIAGIFWPKKDKD